MIYVPIDCQVCSRFNQSYHFLKKKRCDYLVLIFKFLIIRIISIRKLTYFLMLMGLVERKAHYDSARCVCSGESRRGFRHIAAVIKE